MNTKTKTTKFEELKSLYEVVRRGKEIEVYDKKGFCFSSEIFFSDLLNESNKKDLIDLTLLYLLSNEDESLNSELKDLYNKVELSILKMLNISQK